jgi:thiamine phosphate synthase YjbQ (UPF0047 family)
MHKGFLHNGVAIINGTFDFGPWELIFYGEFDGKRKKRGWSRSSEHSPDIY